MDEVKRKDEQKRDLLQLLFAEALGQGNFSLLERLFAPDFIDHSTPAQAAGYAGVREYFAAVRAGFPDIQVTLDDIIVEGERVAVRTTWRGTHLGEYEGTVPTGKTVSRSLIQIFHFVDGLIAEEWNAGTGLLENIQK
jgi:steroid delta-isomerase-like uncharacterized protein